MKHLNRILLTCALTLSVLALLMVARPPARAEAIPVTTFAAPARLRCQVGDFFGLIPWYGYFSESDFDASCNVDLKVVQGNQLNGSNVNKVWLIALAVFEDLLRIAGVMAFAFVIYGGIRYTTSQGEPENTKAAMGTIMNAIIGLAIAFVAAASVSFIGNKLGGG